MRKLNIDYRNPADLHPRETNPRTHNKKQIRQIADSIKKFGFTNPILIDCTDGVVAGHGRIEAAKFIGMEMVPTIRLEDMTEAEIRAYVIADNKLAENAGWDRELLAIKLQGLLEIDLDFDVTLTGFEMGEIDVLIGEYEIEEEVDPADRFTGLTDGPPVTRPEDIWCIGKHRLICGDATDHDTFDRLLDGSKAQMVFTDPPYNVPVDGHVCGLGNVKHREFAMAVGEMTEGQFTSFLSSAFENLANFCADGAIHFVCMDWRHMGEVMAAGRDAYAELKHLCVWAKTNGGMGSLYRSQHELVFVFKSGRGPHINNVELGKHGRNRTNVWSYSGINSFGENRNAELALHPTVKPVKLVSDAILDCSRRDGIILDAFAGSGTTLLAAQQTGRYGYGIELDPYYCDVIVRRLCTAAKTEAVHLETGQPFIEIEQQRLEESQRPESNNDHPHDEARNAKE